MSRIDQIAQIIYEEAGETVQVVDNPADYEFGAAEYALVLSPSQSLLAGYYEEIDLYDLYIISSTIATRELKRTNICKAKSIYPNGYTYNNDRGYFTVASATGFAVGGSISTDAGASTATIYSISGNTIYVKDIVGSFDLGDTITDGVDSTTLTSNTTAVIYPFIIDIQPQEQSDSWIRLEISARWAL